MPITCTHTKMITPGVKPESTVCTACEKIGQEWVNLRACQTCGHVGCCETSKGMHAKKHFEATGHPIVKPLGTDEDWTWCYADRNYINNGV